MSPPTADAYTHVIAGAGGRGDHVPWEHAARAAQDLADAGLRVQPAGQAHLLVHTGTGPRELSTTPSARQAMAALAVALDELDQLLAGTLQQHLADGHLHTPIDRLPAPHPSTLEAIPWQGAYVAADERSLATAALALAAQVTGRTAFGQDVRLPAGLDVLSTLLADMTATADAHRAAPVSFLWNAHHWAGVHTVGADPALLSRSHLLAATTPSRN